MSHILMVNHHDKSAGQYHSTRDWGQCPFACFFGKTLLINYLIGNFHPKFVNKGTGMLYTMHCCHDSEVWQALRDVQSGRHMPRKGCLDVGRVEVLLSQTTGLRKVMESLWPCDFHKLWLKDARHEVIVIESWLISDHSPWLLAVSRRTSSPSNKQFHFTVSFSQQVPTVSSSILLQFSAMFSSTGKKRYRWYLQDFQCLHWHLRKFMLIVEWHGQLNSANLSCSQ